MIFTQTRKLETAAIDELIQNARNFEISNFINESLDLFKPIWGDIEEDPDFSCYTQRQGAELYRLCGYFLSIYGKSRNVKLYQERAKNLLTKSIELYDLLGMNDHSAEAKVVMALSYFYDGAIQESESILRQVSELYEADHLNPVFLKACLNRLLVMHWKSEYADALEILREIEIPMEFCTDDRLLYMFHSQAGMIFRGISQFEKAIFHYNRAIEKGREVGHLMTVANNHNNLAFLYKNIKAFELAHYHVEIAIKIHQENNFVGWLPHALDTKSLIYYAENKPALALEAINEAIELFREGDDFAVLVDAVWNKVRYLLALRQKEEAVLLFAELAQTAQIHIGEVAVKKYTKLFTDIIYIKHDDSLESEVRRFKKSEIANALGRSNYNFPNAALALGFETTNKLFRVIDTEFPELYEEIGILPRTKHPKIKHINKPAGNSLTRIETDEGRSINKLRLRGVVMDFGPDFRINSVDPIATFYCSGEEMLRKFGIGIDSVLAVDPTGAKKAGEFFIVRSSSSNRYFLAQVFRDQGLEIDYLINDGMPFTFDEVEIIGRAIGYGAFEEADSERISFKALPRLAVAA